MNLTDKCAFTVTPLNIIELMARGYNVATVFTMSRYAHRNNRERKGKVSFAASLEA